MAGFTEKIVHGAAQSSTMTDSENTQKPPQGQSAGHAPQTQSSPDPEKDAAKQQDQSQQKDKPEKQDGGHEEKQPAGGYDSTPIPQAPPGWTIKITFHRATNLPMADLNSLSSDPYVLAQLTSALQPRHKEDPYLRVRTPTIRRNVNPSWESEWIVTNVPSSGFKLKARVYDEDPADHDDRLGNVHVDVHSIHEGWQGIKDQPYKIKKRAGSKRAYAIRSFATCFKAAKHMHGDLYISIELLGKSKDQNGGRMYTVGPCWWTRHYSPMLGRLTKTKESSNNKPQSKGQANGQGQGQSDGGNEQSPRGSEASKRKAQAYNFQANQVQLAGPVPAELYHRYVEFKPFVKGMFTSKGIRGYILSKALHHQHARVYNFDRTTEWGHFPDGPCEDMTKKFLDLVHHDQGGRIFTYVLTLDALFRFTETGKEFGIDLLSKHTMHSDVSIYIAFSGEFFIRRLKHPRRPPPPEPAEETSQVHHDESPGHNETHPPNDVSGGPPNDDPPEDPAYYELVIDNDSGTYRPNAKLLPLLKKFLSASLPGIHVQVLDCVADKEKMDKWKDQQRQRKKQEGQQMVFQQNSRSSSISSSDEEDLDAMAQRDDQAGDSSGLKKALRNDATSRVNAKKEHFKNYGPHHPRGGEDGTVQGTDEGQGIGASER